MTTETTCQGRWLTILDDAVMDGPDRVSVLRCSDCRDWWVILNSMDAATVDHEEAPDHRTAARLGIARILAKRVA